MKVIDLINGSKTTSFLIENFISLKRAKSIKKIYNLINKKNNTPKKLL